MDEILIEEKKYVSSKQAAKITGYAKDYIGQLCREGRVPARLVGRGWYVLESAIQDHRFGNQDNEPKDVAPAVLPAVEPAVWGFPRYEASKVEVLPLINRLHEEEIASEPLQTEESQETAPQAPSQDIHESWKAWFDKIADAAVPEESTEQPVAEVAVTTEEKMEEEYEVEAEVIPLHIHHTELVARDLRVRESLTASEPQETPRRGSNRVLVRSIQMAGVLIAVITLTLACIGTGYFDAFFISNNQVSVISGITTYTK